MRLELFQTFCRQRSKWIVLALIILCGTTIYAASLGNGYIWDDDYYVYKNGLVQTTAGIKDIWFSHTLPQYYPLTFTSFWLEYKLWGLQPFGYHAVNLFLHLLNAVLVFFIVRKLNQRAAAAVALLFTVHPIQVETVAWITERKNLLALSFTLLACLSYLRFEERAAKRSYVASLFLFAMALLSKSVSVCFAVVPLLLAWWRQGKIRWKDILRTLPLFVLGLSAAFHTAYVEVHRAGAEGAEWNLGLGGKMVLAGRILLFYLQKILVPSNFMFFYPRWRLDPFQFWQWIYPAFALFILVLLYFARKRIGRGACALYVFYIASIFPALGFFNVFPMQYSYVADHFSYFSTFPLLLLIASTFFFLGDRLADRAGKFGANVWRTSSWIAFAALLVFLSTNSFALTRNYKDSFALWSNLVKVNPTSAVGHLNLGNIYLSKGDHEKAALMFRKAILLDPNEFMAYNSLGTILHALGRNDEAIATFLKAVKVNPEFYVGYYNLGLCYHASGDDTLAIAALEEAIRISGNYAKAYLTLANIFFAKKDYQKAAVLYRRTIDLSPTDPDAYANLALILDAFGERNLAEKLSRHAQILEKDANELDNELGRLPT